MKSFIVCFLEIRNNFISVSSLHTTADKITPPPIKSTYIIQKFQFIVILSYTPVNTDPCHQNPGLIHGEGDGIRTAVPAVPHRMLAGPGEAVGGH